MSIKNYRFFLGSTAFLTKIRAKIEKNMPKKGSKKGQNRGSQKKRQKRGSFPLHFTSYGPPHFLVHFLVKKGVKKWIFQFSLLKKNPGNFLHNFFAARKKPDSGKWALFCTRVFGWFFGGFLHREKVAIFGGFWTPF